MQTTGVCTNIRVRRSFNPPFGLDEQAIKAAAEWRFRPGTRRGQPVPVLGLCSVAFGLLDMAMFSYPLLWKIVPPGLLIIVLVGMWLTVSPWRLRDFLDWATATEKRIKVGCGIRLAFGLFVAMLGLTTY